MMQSIEGTTVGAAVSGGEVLMGLGTWREWTKLPAVGVGSCNAQLKGRKGSGHELRTGVGLEEWPIVPGLSLSALFCFFLRPRAL